MTRWEDSSGNLYQATVELKETVSAVIPLSRDACLVRITRVPHKIAGEYIPGPYDAPSEFDYLIDKTKVHLVDDPELITEISKIKDPSAILKRLRAKTSRYGPCFVFPLYAGQRFAEDDYIREDGLYQWIVRKGKSGKVPGKLSRNIFVLRYKSVPDEEEVNFIPGIGISRQKYRHHGFVTEWDLRLVSYQLSKTSRQEKRAKKAEQGGQSLGESGPEHTHVLGNKGLPPP